MKETRAERRIADLRAHEIAREKRSEMLRERKFANVARCPHGYPETNPTTNASTLCHRPECAHNGTK
jgi:hypothetical protein